MGAKRPLITLTTDFGTKDPFVGQMKGVILNINPEAEFVDISHEITPHNIREGALITGLSYMYFPPKTIHLAVVDPGVGSRRRPIIVATRNHYFIGPDNGLFSMIYKKEEDFLYITHITADHYFLEKESPTFQGRDIFAAIAGWLSKGIPVNHFGEKIDDYTSIYLSEPATPTNNTLEGEVMYIDRFGNAITNIPSDLLKDFFQRNKKVRIILKGREISMKRHYSEAGDRELYCLINSFGLLEFFCCRENAAEVVGIKTGDIVGIIGS